MKFPNKDEMKARFWDLTDQIEAIGIETSGFREDAQKLRETIDPLKVELKQVNADINTIEMPRMHDLKMELATISRALGMKVGSRPGV